MPSTKVATDLLEKLKRLQSKEDLSDHKFAIKLGVSYQLWQMTRTGVKEIGFTILKACKAYPQLWWDVLIFLGFDVESLSLNVGIFTDTRQTHQNGILARLWGLLRKLYWWIAPIR